MPFPAPFENRGKEVLIAVNPKAGSGSRGEIIEQLVVKIEKAGLFPQVISDIDQIVLTAQASLATHSLRAVVAAGGDGTIRLLADQLPPGTPLTILPLGTENLLAKYFDFQRNAAGLCEILTSGVEIQLDAGLAGNRLFTLMVGCGFDANVVHQVLNNRTGNINRWAYFKPIWDSVRTYAYPEMKVLFQPVAGEGISSSPGLSRQVLARFVYVVNLPRYAAGLSFSPTANGSDGLLNVVTFSGGGLWKGLQYLTGVFLGRHEKFRDCKVFQTKRLRIEPASDTNSSQPDTGIPLQVDGDPAGELPIDIEVLPRRLTFLVSPRWAKRNPNAMITTT